MTQCSRVERFAAPRAAGALLYSALAIRLWGHEVGINAVVGHEYPEEYLERLRAHGIATSGVLRIPGWSLRLWLLHEENNRKQQVQKLQASTFAELDAVRPDPPADYLTAVGYHLSPATPEGQMRSRDVVRAARPDALISLDILIEPYLNADLYRRGDALQGIDIFSPSVMETEALWPGVEMKELLPMLAGYGMRWIAIKMDARGSIVYDAATQHAWQHSDLQGRGRRYYRRRRRLFGRLPRGHRPDRGRGRGGPARHSDGVARDRELGGAGIVGAGFGYPQAPYRESEK